MNDEEKIDIVRSFIKTCDSYDGEISIKTDGLTKCAIENLLTLIEKKSKEIEELKENNKKLQDKCKELIFEKQELTSALLDSTPNDKIKAKIEWLTENILENDYASDYDKDTAEYQVIILQSLLEKE